MLGSPRGLFPARSQAYDLALSVPEQSALDPHPDGTRFIGTRQVAPPLVRSLLFVENWVAAFKRPAVGGR